MLSEIQIKGVVGSLYSVDSWCESITFHFVGVTGCLTECSQELVNGHFRLIVLRECKETIHIILYFFGAVILNGCDKLLSASLFIWELMAYFVQIVIIHLVSAFGSNVVSRPVRR